MRSTTIKSRNKTGSEGVHAGMSARKSAVCCRVESQAGRSQVQSRGKVGPVGWGPLAAVLLRGLLVGALVLASPAGVVTRVEAAPLEDCDLDGYDDHTGVLLPWVGFDSTRGDELPAGWGESSDDEGESSSGKGSNKITGGKSSGSAGNSFDDDSSSQGSSSGSGSSSQGSSSSQSSAGSASGSASAGTGSDSGKASDAASDGAAAGAAAETTQTAAAAAALTGEAATSSLDTTAIVATKGTIKVSDEDGALVHVGGTIRVSGTGFAGNVADLLVEIHSTPRSLGTVRTDTEGAFELVTALPAGLATGTHHVVVSYKGQEIARQTVVVGSPVADSFLRALLVGFTGENEELSAGLAILAGLAVAGGLAFGFSFVQRKRHSSRSIPVISGMPH